VRDDPDQTAVPDRASAAEGGRSAAGPAPMTVGEVLDGARDALGAVAAGTRRWLGRGRHRKLRLTRHGKQVLPDIPLAAVAVAEAASLYGAGLARLLVVHLGARFLFDVEVVNDADRLWKEGLERFLEGDLEHAERALLEAVRMDDTHAPSFLQLGVLHRLRGEPERARRSLERACRLAGDSEVGRKARALLAALDPAPPPGSDR
jgi:tetratricopeptide (TPR) repeat protein